MPRNSCSYESWLDQNDKHALFSNRLISRNYNLSKNLVYSFELNQICLNEAKVILSNLFILIQAKHLRLLSSPPNMQITLSRRLHVTRNQAAQQTNVTFQFLNRLFQVGKKILAKNPVTIM